MPGDRGWTELHEAAKRGHLDAVRLLLEHGADPNAREPGDNTTPLHWAAAHGHVDVVRGLLDAGADVHGVGDVKHLARNSIHLSPPTRTRGRAGHRHSRSLGRAARYGHSCRT